MKIISDNELLNDTKIHLMIDQSKIPTKEIEYKLINKETFFKILPQIAFAFIIFGLMFFTVYFFRYTVAKQEALSDERSNLISNLTHELKTPVATIAIALEAIEHYGVLQNKEKTKEYINNAQNEIKRLTTGIDQMLKVSKFDEANLFFKLEKVVLNDLCLKTVQSISSQAKQYDINLKWEIPNEEIWILGEAEHLLNVVINLCDNAIKYRRTSNAEIQIILKTINDSNIIEVIDNGIGIENKHHKKIFERFYRVSEENIHNVKGYGMGLSYVKKVLEAHSATIEVESELNQGSTFRIGFKKIGS